VHPAIANFFKGNDMNFRINTLIGESELIRSFQSLGKDTKT
jgi:hypothetical protein